MSMIKKNLKENQIKVKMKKFNMKKRMNKKNNLMLHYWTPTCNMKMNFSQCKKKKKLRKRPSEIEYCYHESKQKNCVKKKNPGA